MDTQEVELLHFADRTVKAPSDLVAVVLDLSGIPHVEDVVFFRVLRQRLKQQLAGIRHQSYHLPHHLICLVAERGPAERVVAVARQLQRFLADAGRGSVVWTVYDLGRQASELHAVAQRLAKESRGKSDDDAADRDLAVYMELHRGLSHADIANLVRERTLWSLANPASPVEFCRALSIDLPEIEQMFDVNLHENPWLFDQVMEMLDVRLFGHIVQERIGKGHRLSANVHAVAVLNHDLDDLVHRIPRGERGGIIAELPYVEALNDETQFWETVSVLRDYGFGVALDGVPWTSLPHVALDPARFVLIKVIWDDDLGPAFEARFAELRAAVLALGPERCAMYRLPGADAVAKAMELGFRLVQGPGVDGQALAIGGEHLHAAERAAAPANAAAERPEPETPKSGIWRIIG